MYQDQQRPPLNSQPSSKIQQRFADQPLSSTARAQANSKWSINIQEIVKRTQRNLERGSNNAPSSLTRTYEEKPSYQQDPQFPQKSSLEDVVPGKATNLYRELKQKLSVDSSTGKPVSQSTKSVLRPQSAASNSKNLLSKHLQREKGGGSRERAPILHDHQFFQKQSLAAPSVQSGQGGDNCLTNLDEEDEADLEAQLLLMGGGVRHATSTTKPEVNKRVQEIENRQKIFEDEIIKRIKEIQRYTKSIHLQVKKQSQAHAELEESHDRLQKRCLEQQHNQASSGQGDTSDLQAQLDDMRDTFLPQLCTELTQQLKQEMSHKISQEVRSQVDRSHKNHPPVDTLKIQETIMARVQEYIDDANDSSQQTIQIEDLKSRVASIQAVSAQTQKEQKHMGLKLDKMDLRLDSYHDQLSQQMDFSQDNNHSEHALQQLKLELQSQIEEVDTKLSLKFQHFQKQAQQGKSEQDKKLQDHQKMLQELSQLNQEDPSAQLIERVDDLESKLESDLKATAQEMLHGADLQAQQKIKRVQQQVTQSQTQLDEKLAQVLQECQELTTDVETKLQSKVDRLSVQVDKQQMGAEKQLKGMKAAIDTVNKSNFVDESKLQQVVSQLSQQQQQQPPQPQIIEKAAPAQPQPDTSSKVGGISSDELQDRLQDIETKITHSVEDLLAELVQSSELESFQRGFDKKFEDHQTKFTQQTDEVSKNLLALSQRVGQNNQKFLTEDKLESQVQEIEQRLEDSQAYGLERAQDEIQAKLTKMDKSVKQQLSDAQEQQQEMVMKNYKTLEALQKQINTVSGDLKKSSSQPALPKVDKVDEVAQKLSKVQDQVDKLDTVTKEHTTQFEKHFQTLTDLASLVQKIQQEQSASQPQIPLQTTQVLGLENIQMQLDEQNDSIFELQQSLQKVKKQMPVDDLKKSGSFLGQAAEKQVQENVLKEVQLQIDSLDSKLSVLDQQLQESLQQDTGVDALSQKVREVTKEFKEFQDEAVTRDEMQLIQNTDGVCREDFNVLQQEMDEVEGKVMLALKEELAKKVSALAQGQVSMDEVRDEVAQSMHQAVSNLQEVRKELAQVREELLSELSSELEKVAQRDEVQFLLKQVEQGDEKVMRELDQLISQVQKQIDSVEVQQNERLSTQKESLQSQISQLQKNISESQTKEPNVSTEELSDLKSQLALKLSEDDLSKLDTTITQRLASTVQHFEKQSQSNAHDIQCCKQALASMEAMIMQMTQSFAKVSQNYNTQQNTTNDLYDLVQKVDSKIVEAQKELNRKIESIPVQVVQAPQAAAAAIQEVEPQTLDKIPSLTLEEQVHKVQDNDEYTDDDDFEEPIVVSRDSQLQQQVDDSQDYPQIVKVDDIVVQPVEEPAEEKPTTEALISPKSLNQSQAFLIKPESDNGDSDVVPGDSEEQSPDKSQDQPLPMTDRDSEKDLLDLNPVSELQQPHPVSDRNSEEDIMEPVQHPAQPITDRDSTEDLLDLNPTTKIIDPLGKHASRDSTEDLLDLNPTAKIIEKQNSERDSTEDLLDLNPTTKIIEEQISLDLNPTAQLVDPLSKQESDEHLSEPDSDNIAVPSKLEDKQLWDSQQMLLSQSQNLTGALGNLKDLQDADSRQILPESVEASSQQESSMLNLDERPSLGGILDSGNFYQSEDMDNSAVKEVLQDQLYQDSEQELDIDIEVVTPTKVQIEQSQHQEQSESDQQLKAIESFVMSEILAALELHNLNQAGNI